MPARTPKTTASDQAELSHKAQDLKERADHPDQPAPRTKASDPGKRDMDETARDDIAPSGAFEHAGDKPSRERSRERR